MSDLQKLFEPIKISLMTLKNRIVMPALGLRYDAPHFHDFYQERAKGGTGLLVCGIATVDWERPSAEVYALVDNERLPSLRQFTDDLHAYGAKVAAQLSARLLWQKEPSARRELVGPSTATASRAPDAPRPRPLTTEEIQHVVEAMGEAARRAFQAGFDAVEYHALAGSTLLSQFLSPLTNRRTDGYGGHLENRARLLLEVIENAKSKVGKDYPILCRLSGDDFMEGGNTLAETKIIARMLEGAGVHALDVSTGWHESPVPFIQASIAPGAWLFLGEEVKKQVSLPIISGTRLNEPLLADQVLKQGRVDLVYIARALIADPYFPIKAKEGRFQDIRPCTACGHCMDRALEEPMTCSVNPRAGREASYQIQPASQSKKVFIIGGGPAGMEAAAMAAARGHQVTLWEKNRKLGGNLLLAAVPPHKSEYRDFNNYLLRKLTASGVELKLDKEFTPEVLERAKPDAVILATGSSPVIPEIPGVKGANVLTALEVLEGKATGAQVVIIGGGLIGCETAEFLAAKGKKVTILEMLDRIGNDIGRSTRWVIMQRLRKASIQMETKAKAEAISEKGVTVSRGSQSLFFPANTVVLAVGMKPNQELRRQLEGKVPLYSIGDSVEPRRITQAMQEAFEVASQL